MPKKKKTNKTIDDKPKLELAENEAYNSLKDSVIKVLAELEEKFNLAQKNSAVTGATIEIGRANGLKEALDLLKTIQV